MSKASANGGRPEGLGEWRSAVGQDRVVRSVKGMGDGRGERVK